METKANDQTIETKAGYVAIIGKPNAGKSTLMNSLIGANLSIITHKPQTTRKRVLGIYTEGNTQIVFLDTPGVLTPKYEMQESMMRYVRNSIEEADCLILIYDITKFNKLDPIPEELLEFFKDTRKKIILILNKIDLLKDVKETLPIIATFDKMQLFADIIPVISEYIPKSHFYYDKELLSTQPERFFVSEIIREAILLSYHEEIPYSTEVHIVDFKERDFGKWYINAEIIVEKQTQKKIIIGSNGEKLKTVLERARKNIEEHLEQEIEKNIKNYWEEINNE